MSIDYKLIGNRIKSRRNQLKLTQEQLAEALHVSVGFISQIERGITKPNLDMLSSISKILDCDICHFISNVSVNNNAFLNSEITEMLESMSTPQKQMLLEIAGIIKTKQIQ